MALLSSAARFAAISIPRPQQRARRAASRRPIRAASAVLSDQRARFVAKRTESASVQQLQRPLGERRPLQSLRISAVQPFISFHLVAAEYMSLPASQYSVLDAERIERVDENTFRCFVYRFKFFSFEVCPVLMVRVEEERGGCCIRLLSCKVLIPVFLELPKKRMKRSDLMLLVRPLLLIPHSWRALRSSLLRTRSSPVRDASLLLYLKTSC